MHGYGYRLGVIAYGAAAHGQKQIGIMISGNCHTFAQLVQSGVGHDAGDFCHRFTAAAEQIQHGIVDTVFLDGALPINQRNIGAVFRQFPAQIIQGSRAEIEFCRVTVCKITKHKYNHLLFLQRK